MKKNLVIVSQEQFGYHIDSYYYCMYLRDDFDINYICWDQGLPKIWMRKIKIDYISRKGNFIKRSFKFIKIVLNRIDANSKNNLIVFIIYFKIVSLILKILKPNHICVIDIRTGNVEPGKIKRAFYDVLLKFETKFFNNVTVVSESLAKKLKIGHRAHILPLGADIISTNIKEFDELNLLYVGTLFNRNIDDTVKGFKKFYDEFNHKIHITYTIIGSGKNNEEESLKLLVEKINMQKVVNVTGPIIHDKLKMYFEYCNIGVSFIPKTDYYDCQPPTKTFEYLLAGIPVIATSIFEHKKNIGLENGVLIRDTEEGFYEGLKTIYSNRARFNSQAIRNEQMNFTWKNIVTNNLKKYLAGCLSNSNQ